MMIEHDWQLAREEAVLARHRAAAASCLGS
jgi:hypothetical protein